MKNYNRSIREFHLFKDEVHLLRKRLLANSFITNFNNSVSVKARSNKFAWQKRVCYEYVNAMRSQLISIIRMILPWYEFKINKKTLVLGNLHIESLLGKFQQLKVLNLIF